MTPEMKALLSTPEGRAKLASHMIVPIRCGVSGIGERLPGPEDKRIFTAVEHYDREDHKYEGKTEDELAEQLDAELTRHDWFACMDSYSVTRAGENHMDSVIRPLLVHLPEKRGTAIWQKYAPKQIRPNPYSV